MYPTAEVRWFYPGEIPKKVLTGYIQAGSEPTQFPPRTDHYLATPGRDDLGIKMREGFLEIKQRGDSYGIHHFNQDVSGSIEAWQKVRVELSQIDSGLAARGFFSDGDNWIAVRKHRWLRSYQVMEIGDIAEVPLCTDRANGCEWELSQVYFGEMENPWWSLAFEAFGNPTVLVNNLIIVVEETFTGIGHKPYDSNDSFSYPSLLNLNT